MLRLLALSISTALWVTLQVFSVTFLDFFYDVAILGVHGGQVQVPGRMVYNRPPPGFGDLPSGWGVRLEPCGSNHELESRVPESEMAERLARSQGNLLQPDFGYS